MSDPKLPLERLGAAMARMQDHGRAALPKARLADVLAALDAPPRSSRPFLAAFVATAAAVCVLVLVWLRSGEDGPAVVAGEPPADLVKMMGAYVTAPESAKRPTLVSYVWCPSCRKFVGSRARHPAGLVFSDPLAALPAAERREIERSLTGFLAHLDRLWDAGALPQTFAAA